MAYSTKLSDALHLLVFVATEPDSDLSSTAIAKSLAANPSSVRQLMALQPAETMGSMAVLLTDDLPEAGCPRRFYCMEEAADSCAGREAADVSPPCICACSSLTKRHT